MNLEPVFFIFLRLILLFEIYLGIIFYFFFKMICRFGDIKV